MYFRVMQYSKYFLGTPTNLNIRDSTCKCIKTDINIYLFIIYLFIIMVINLFSGHPRGSDGEVVGSALVSFNSLHLWLIHLTWLRNIERIVFG